MTASLTPSERPTAPPPVEDNATEVWAATWDVGGLKRLSLRLHGRARVIPVHELRALGGAGSSTIVLLDACAPEVDLVEAAAVLVGSAATIVVWGANQTLRETLANEPGTRGWVHIPPDTTPAELAEMLSSMF